MKKMPHEVKMCFDCGRMCWSGHEKVEDHPNVYCFRVHEKESPQSRADCYQYAFETLKNNVRSIAHGFRMMYAALERWTRYAEASVENLPSKKLDQLFDQAVLETQIGQKATAQICQNTTSLSGKHVFNPQDAEPRKCVWCGSIAEKTWAEPA